MTARRTAGKKADWTSGVSRRELLRCLAGAGFSAPVIASILASEGLAQEATQTASPPAPQPDPSLAGVDPRLIALDPLNLETPLYLLDDLIVPNELFFVRNHAPAPMIAPEDYRLRVTGHVDQELELTLADLKGMPQQTITAFLECSGNSRSRFEPIAEGNQWGNGAVGTAEWTGVRLRDLLDRARVKDGAVDVVSQGGDLEVMQRGLPMSKAYDPNTLVVWQMNGADLPRPHGGPVRLFVPGWGGIASTKWLIELRVLDHVFNGRFNSVAYQIITEEGINVRPVREVPVKSVITRPQPGEQLAAGQQTLVGYAWSGYGGISRIEVSVDDGATWTEAQITKAAGWLAWVRFEHSWDAKPGQTRLLSRATDELGEQQPTTVPWNAKGYLMNAIYAVPVTVA
ncbi:MAG: sulfite oxidase [Chloroflexota bacterium]